MDTIDCRPKPRPLGNNDDEPDYGLDGNLPAPFEELIVCFEKMLELNLNRGQAERFCEHVAPTICELTDYDERLLPTVIDKMLNSDNPVLREHAIILLPCFAEMCVTPEESQRILDALVASFLRERTRPRKQRLDILTYGVMEQWDEAAVKPMLEVWKNSSDPCELVIAQDILETMLSKWPGEPIVHELL